MIARAENSHQLTVRELIELLAQYVAENGLSPDALVEVVVCDLDIPDAQTSYPATIAACHISKEALYIYAAKEQSDE